MTVAWLYSTPDMRGRGRTHDFSFGADVPDKGGVPDELREALESWADGLSAGAFAVDASSKGVKAWAIRHKAVVPHQDALVKRRRSVIRELADP